MAKIQQWLLDYWTFIVTALLAFAALASFMLYKITSTPIGYSPVEWKIHNNLIARTYTLSYLWNHVTFAPYYLILSVPQYLHRYGLFSIRSVGAFFGLLCALIFFYISWRWWGNLIALLGGLLFTTSLWFLQISRNSGPDVLYIFAALVIILLGFVIRNEKRHETKTLLSALLALVLLYIPGIIWFVLAACILQRKLILEEFRKLPTQVKFIIPLAGLIFVFPLIHAGITNVSELKTILGLPLHFSTHNFFKKLLEWPLIIFIRNPAIGIFSIGHLPILSLFIDVMFILGLYWIWLKRKLDRFYLLGATIILSWILYGLGGPVSIYLSLPFVMCVATTGIAFILGQWFTIFPRNPVARIIGMTILILAVVVVSWFHVDEYFVAWPHTLHTIAVYSTHK
jgi:hypothetical protein